MPTQASKAWRTVADDSDPETQFHWARHSSVSSESYASGGAQNLMMMV